MRPQNRIISCNRIYHHAETIPWGIGTNPDIHLHRDIEFLSIWNHLNFGEDFRGYQVGFSDDKGDRIIVDTYARSVTIHRIDTGTVTTRHLAKVSSKSLETWAETMMKEYTRYRR